MPDSDETLGPQLNSATVATEEGTDSKVGDLIEEMVAPAQADTGVLTERETVSSDKLTKSLRKRQTRAEGLVSIPKAAFMMFVYAEMIKMHFAMEKIKDVSDGLSFLIEGETGEAPAFTDITEVDEIWQWSNEHLLALLWPEPCIYGCNNPAAANYGAVQSDAAVQPKYPDDFAKWCSNETGKCLDNFGTCAHCRPKPSGGRPGRIASYNFSGNPKDGTRIAPDIPCSNSESGPGAPTGYGMCYSCIDAAEFVKLSGSIIIGNTGEVAKIITETFFIETINLYVKQFVSIRQHGLSHSRFLSLPILCDSISPSLLPARHSPPFPFHSLSLIDLPLPFLDWPSTAFP